MTRKPVLPNPTQPRAPIELDGQTYNLAFDFHAICEAERVAGVNLLHAIEFDGLNAQQFRGLLYAALLKFQPSTTLADVSALIRLDTIKPIIDGILAAWKASQPDPEKGDPKAARE